MNRILKLALILALPVILPVKAGEGGVHWTYEGAHGPDHWGDLSPDFIQCKVGLNQSPIDIVDTIDADLPPLELDYTSSTVDLVNNGHAAQANVEPGNFLRVGGETFELIQLHLHTPSEHRINGKSFPMESHYVHRNERGELAVVGVLHSEGQTSEYLEKLESAIPVQVNKPVAFRVALSETPINSLDKAYYRYNGSLTTPPCSEGVRWFVLKQPSPIAPAQQRVYRKLIGDDARDLQPVNARVVLE